MGAGREEWWWGGGVGGGGGGAKYEVTKREHQYFGLTFLLFGMHNHSKAGATTPTHLVKIRLLPGHRGKHRAVCLRPDWPAVPVSAKTSAAR